MSALGMLSPPASAKSTSPGLATVSTRRANLPTARRHPLQPGSQKEVSLISFLDNKLLRISRRYGKKFSSSAREVDDDAGYTTFEQVIADIDPLIDVVWVSGTAHLQVSYLLTVAGLLCSYMPAFPLFPAMFPTFAKLDRAFITLLRQESTTFSTTKMGPAITVTEKVRIRSLVEETRITAVNVASNSEQNAGLTDITTDDDRSEDGIGEPDLTDEASPEDVTVGVQLGRMYKGSLEILGASLPQSTD